MGSSDRVASPTFTVSRIYKASDLELHHFDFYRLAEAGLMEHELQDSFGDPKVVVVVEWGDAVKHVLPSERLTIQISKTGDDGRKLELCCPKSISYLIEGIC
jgi:tRNA threonylcarbamoyladenosine biosynthesis protein TsaE